MIVSSVVKRKERNGVAGRREVPDRVYEAKGMT